MSSGEWDLRALKALEEEEQKEFLALSQKNLFEPPLATGAPEFGSAGIPNAKPALAYAQLHPHLLKLPTIDECHLIAAQRQAAAASVTSGSTRLKFTRALSLSAHSLSSRTGGGSGYAAGFGKKLKARLVGAKSSGSLSPSRHSHSYSVSPVYTPPPMRRCATLHHTQPVRKTFKTLQQLERQKRQKASSNPAATQPQMQRIAGTNKTYWKYGINSTAASIIGQRARLQQQQQQQQQQQLQLSELESNASDEPNMDIVDSELLDSATETGSCSVPLPPADSNELLRLSMMLSAASSAVTGTVTESATGGSGRRYQAQSDDVEDDAETVAYEAFHRPKSFERTLLRGSSLTVTGQESHCHSPNPSPNRSRPMQSTSGSRIFKSTSLDAPAVGIPLGGVGTVVEQQQHQHQHQQKQHQHQQIIGQPLAMMSMTAVTNQLSAEHKTNEAHYQHHDAGGGAGAAAAAGGSGSGSGGDWQHVKYHQDLNAACYGHSALLSGATLDDELEQHIKHCSCSCNHMGYGNSMDYQVSTIILPFCQLIHKKCEARNS